MRFVVGDSVIIGAGLHKGKSGTIVAASNNLSSRPSYRIQLDHPVYPEMTFWQDELEQIEAPISDYEMMPESLWGY